jgi:hypothetical protein
MEHKIQSLPQELRTLHWGQQTWTTENVGVWVTRWGPVFIDFYCPYCLVPDPQNFLKVSWAIFDREFGNKQP